LTQGELRSKAKQDQYMMACELTRGNKLINESASYQSCDSYDIVKLLTQFPRRSNVSTEKHC